MRTVKIVLLLILISISLLASYPPNWILDISHDNNKTFYTLSYHPWNYNRPLDSKSLPYCLTRIDKVFAIRIMLPLENCKLQDEIKTYYKKHFPQELKEALKSSDNLHNPTLNPLIKHFPEALRATSLYKDLNQTLKSNGFTLEKEISFEKFMIFEHLDPYLFHADIWLHAKPVSP